MHVPADQHIPIVWMRLGQGLQIQDLTPEYFSEIIDVIQTDFINEDIIFKSSDIENDSDSILNFCDKLWDKMETFLSLAVIDQLNHDTLAGVLILQLVKKYDYGRSFSKTHLTTGPCYSSILNFINTLYGSVDMFLTFNCESFIRYYLLYIKPEYRHNYLIYHLMQSAMEVARSINVPVVMGLFSCPIVQKIAKQLGMQLINTIYYGSWVDDTGYLNFENPGNGGCALMACPVPPLAPAQYETPAHKPTHNPKPSKKESKKKKKGKK